MQFYSIKGEAPEVGFRTALFASLAPDGGLYMPRAIPKITKEALAGVETLDKMAFLVLRKWIDAKEIPDKDLQGIITKALIFPVPLVPVGDYSILELFHGPTMAFKDFAAALLAQLFDYFLAKEKKTITILVATSGDTGGAIAQAFSGMTNVRVVIVYPIGKVSILQEEQLTRVGENVLSLAVAGMFDDCQAFVKRAFHDTDLEKLHLASANSINIGRLIPQIIYYFWAYIQSGRKRLRFVVPSGNMGNATAAVFAYKMGLPLDSLVIATNKNDVAVEYYKTGIYKPKKSIQTLSTAMDIGKPSNFERILELFHYDHEAFCKMITALKATDIQTVKTIQAVYKKENYLMDFHTAVGLYAATKVPVSKIQTVVVSTAAAKKFAKEMKRETGITVDNSGILKNLRMKKKRVRRVEGDYEAIKKQLVQFN